MRAETWPHLSARDRVDRLRAAAPSIAQNAVAAGIAWFIAARVLDHHRPFFAPIAAIVSLGLTSGARTRRAIELCVGVTLGILVADLLVHAIGRGILSLIVVVAISMSVAILIGGGDLLVRQAATSAVLISTIATTGNPFARSVDAVVGCSVALVLNLLVFPADPMRIVRKEGGPLLAELAGVLDDVARALRERDVDAAEAAMVRGRGLDYLVQRFREAVDLGDETARLAPPRRGARADVDRYDVAAERIRTGARNTRVLARAARRAIELGDHVPPAAIEGIECLAEVARALGPALPEGAAEERARARALRAAALASDALEQTGSLGATVIVSQVRSTAVDLLRGMGMDPDEARVAVREARLEGGT